MNRRRSRWLSASASVAAHLALALAIMLAPVTPPEPVVERLPVEVTLVTPRPPEPEPPRPPEPDPGPSQALAPVVSTRSTPPETPPQPVERPVTRAPRPVPADVETVAVSVVAAPEMATVSEAQAAGARTAGSGQGSGGGGAGTGSGTAGATCDMVGRLQSALREDAEVRAALTEASRGPGVRGRALLVWDGDWVLTPGQTGKGLAGVRQAIALEVAFAPAACRAEPMRGLVVVSMADGSGAARVALGRGQWRWSDLLR